MDCPGLAGQAGAAVDALPASALALMGELLLLLLLAFLIVVVTGLTQNTFTDLQGEIRPRLVSQR